MVFVINKLKYDTDKMKLVSEKCSYSYEETLIFGGIVKCSGKNVKLWKSAKDNWLISYETDYSIRARALDKNEVEQLLLKYDLEKYEEIFGELEEA